MTNYQLELEIKKLKSTVNTLKTRIAQLERHKEPKSYMYNASRTPRR